MGNQGNLLFTLATGAITQRGIDAGFELHHRMRREYPQGYVHFMLTRVNSPFPGAAERKRLSELADQFAPHQLGTAIVIEGDGLWAGTLRMVLRTMALTFRQAHPQQFFAASPQALTWLEQQCGLERRFDKAILLDWLEGACQTPPSVAWAR
jgi:hypothetical protein